MARMQILEIIYINSCLLMGAILPSPSLFVKLIVGRVRSVFERTIDSSLPPSQGKAMQSRRVSKPIEFDGITPFLP